MVFLEGNHARTKHKKTKTKNTLLRLLHYVLAVKKMTSKVAYSWQFGFFFSAVPIAQNGPRVNFHIANVSQDTSVH